MNEKTNTTTLVLLPGLDGTSTLFAPLLRHLPEWIQPVVIKYPGTGSNSYEELIEYVDGEVASLERFAVLGWSFGGPLALMLANRRPTQVSAVVLCATFVTPPLPHLVPFRFFTVTPVIFALRALRRVRYVIRGFADEELRRAKAMLWRQVVARVLTARSRAVMSVDARGFLQTCGAPLMYLASAHDRVVPRFCCDEVVRIAPQTKVCEVEGGHLALFTNPGDSVESIAAFLKEVQPQTAALETSMLPVVA